MLEKGFDQSASTVTRRLAKSAKVWPRYDFNHFPLPDSINASLFISGFLIYCIILGTPYEVSLMITHRLAMWAAGMEDWRSGMAFSTNCSCVPLKAKLKNPSVMKEPIWLFDTQDQNLLGGGIVAVKLNLADAMFFQIDPSGHVCRTRWTTCNVYYPHFCQGDEKKLASSLLAYCCN